MSVCVNNYDRVLGALYGIATGDALGMPTSFLRPEYIKEKFGWVDKMYDPEKGHIFHDGLHAGEVTDDTEQAIALIISFVRCKKVEPRDVIQEIIKWAERVKDKYAAPYGPSTERALKAIANGEDITTTGRLGNTNGSAMRIAPLGIIHGLKNSSLDELISDVYLTCLPTHNTQVSNSAAAAAAYGVALAIRGVTDMDELIAGMVEASYQAEKKGYPVTAPSIGKRIEMIYDMVKNSKDDIKTLYEIYDLFGGGDLAADSVPVAIGLFALAKGDTKKAIEYCANIGGDCDTNVAMAGAMAGAMNGIESVPAEWREAVDNKNELNLEKYAQELIDLIPMWNQ